MSEQLIDAAKAPIIAYNNKDWNAKRAVSPNFVYDEVATHRVARCRATSLPTWCSHIRQA